MISEAFAKLANAKKNFDNFDLLERSIPLPKPGSKSILRVHLRKGLMANFCKKGKNLLI